MSTKTTSYKDVTANDNSRLHAGHVYGNVTNNNQYAASPSRTLAPRDEPVHGLFTRAAKEGQHTDRLKALLTQGADIDWKDPDGLGALYYAACRGDEENAKFLLESGADVNSFQTQLGTPVCAAALKGHTLVVDLLLKHKANLDPSYGGALGSAMHAACYGGSIPIVKSLLEGGGRLNRWSQVSLVVFVTVKDEKVVSDSAKKSLAREPRTEANFVMCTPILLAADQHHFKLLRSCWSGHQVEGLEHLNTSYCSPNDTWELFDANSPDNSAPYLNHFSPTYGSVHPASEQSYASKASNSSGWSLMGFPRESPARPSRTLLMWAASLLDLSLIDHLLEAGADAARQDKSGRTALHFAASPYLHANFDNISECIQRLVVCGTSPAGGDMADFPGNEKDCETPLMLAVRPSHPAVDPRVSRIRGPDLQEKFVEQFLISGNDVNAKQRGGHTALMKAVNSKYCCCKPEIVNLLCEAGAAANEVNVHGDTALHLAIKLRAAVDVISALLDHGADPNALTHYIDGPVHPSPLHVAIVYEVSIATIQALLSHGADPNIECGTQGTAMAFAQRAHRLDYVRLFECSTQKPPKASPTSSNGSWFERLPRLGLFDKAA